MKTWLVLDCNYLCYRAFHTTGRLSFNEIKTGVIYGVLRDIVHLQEHFSTENIIFTFDYGKPIRETDYKEYKSTRRVEKSEEEMMTYQELQRQITDLRINYLPALGYKNIFYDLGYEADDVIASICQTLEKKEEAIIVSADHDLWQLLNHRVICYNPTTKKPITRDSFMAEWGISPSQWVDVKAIAGCNSDGIAGIKGVGEKTAVKFLNGTLNPESKAFQSIVKGNHIWKRNKLLVKLPYPGTPTFDTQRDKVTAKRWHNVTRELGMESLYDRLPIRR